MNSKTAKQARRIVRNIRVDGKPLTDELIYEQRNVKQYYSVDRGVRELWGGLFWMPKIRPYHTATLMHSKATKRGAYRALKRNYMRRLKAAVWRRSTTTGTPTA